jgi:hypothetical protein
MSYSTAPEPDSELGPHLLQSYEIKPYSLSTWLSIPSLGLAALLEAQKTLQQILSTN